MPGIRRTSQAARPTSTAARGRWGRGWISGLRNLAEPEHGAARLDRSATRATNAAAKTRRPRRGREGKRLLLFFFARLRALRAFALAFGFGSSIPLRHAEIRLISTELMDIPRRTDILITTPAARTRHEARLSGTFLIDSRAQL